MNTNNKILPVITAILTCLSLRAQADDQLSSIYDLSLRELQTVTVTRAATGTRKNLLEVPATATVIERDDIEAMGAVLLSDILRAVPGVHIGVSTADRMQDNYVIRGIGTELNPQVLVMINNVPVISMWMGAKPDLFRLQARLIERVEVIRGPGSAVYGADAFAGVINIITRDDTPMQASLASGSFGGLEAQWSQHWQGDDWQFNLMLNHQQSDGDDERVISSDLQTQLDPSVSLAPGALQTGYVLNTLDFHAQQENWDINLFFWEQYDAGTGVGAVDVLDPEGRYDSQVFSSRLARHFSVSDQLRLTAWLSVMDMREQAEFVIFPPGATLPIGSDGNVDFTSGVPMTFTDGYIGQPGGHHQDLTAAVTLFDTLNSQHQLRVELGYRHQSMNVWEEKNFGPGVLTPVSGGTVTGTLTDVTDTEFVYVPDKSRFSPFVSLQDEWKLNPAWNLTLGVRYDRYSDFGSTTNPRLGLVWQGDQQVVKMLYGRAFRAPSFSQLYARNNPSTIGNPDLQPETIDTLEFSYMATINQDFTSQLTLFSYQARDLIDQQLTAEGYLSVNIAEQDATGFEWEMKWQAMKSWRLQGHVAYQHSRDADDRQVPFNPVWMFYLSSYWRISENLGWFVECKRVQDRERDVTNVSENRSAALDAQWCNTHLRQTGWLPGLDVGLRVSNLFDRDNYAPANPSIADDYPLEGRSVWLDFTYHFVPGRASASQNTTSAWQVNRLVRN